MNAQALSHILIRAFSYVCFIRLPYGPVQRIGKPDLGGRVILAPTHNNFYCDITVAGSETPKLPRWMAKVGLFCKPFDLLMRFLGAYPIVRILDGAGASGDARATNQATFDGVVRALAEEGAFCIFPEGNCLDRPGLNLPLKNGIAKLALGAEAAAEFGLGLRIVPLGIDYHDRTSFASGVTLRYGEAIHLREFAEAYRADPRRAAKELMGRLTNALLSVFPHFETFEEAECASLLRKLAIERDRLVISAAFARARANRSASSNEPAALRDLLDISFRFYQSFSPGMENVLGNLRLWSGRTAASRFVTYFLLLALLAPAIFSFVNNFVASRILRLLTRKISEAAPDYMTLYVGFSFAVIPIVYMVQFALFRGLGQSDSPWLLGFSLYFCAGITVWMAEQKWRRELPFAWANFLWNSGIARSSLRAARESAAKVEVAFSAIYGPRRESSPGPSA